MREQIIKVVAIILLITIGLFVMYNLYKDFYKLRNSGGTIFEGATSGPDPLEWETNKYKSVTLHDVDDYDIEVRIPAGQTLYATRQGNWGLQEELYDEGVTTGVFMDGKSGDGYIFKGKKGTVRKPQVKVKYQLDTGPYTILYEFRKHDRRGKDNKKVEEYDVNIKVNDRVIPGSPFKNVGVSSGKLKHLGTVDRKMNRAVDDLKNGQPANGEGRRETIVKFTPKTMEIKGNNSVTADVGEKIKEKFTTLKELFSFKERMVGERNPYDEINAGLSHENSMTAEQITWYTTNASKNPLEPSWDPRDNNWYITIPNLPSGIRDGATKTKGAIYNSKKINRHFISLFKQNASGNFGLGKDIGDHMALYNYNKLRYNRSRTINSVDGINKWSKVIFLAPKSEFGQQTPNDLEKLRNAKSESILPSIGTDDQPSPNPQNLILDMLPTLKNLNKGTYALYWQMFGPDGSQKNNPIENKTPDLYGNPRSPFNNSFLLLKFHWDPTKTDVDQKIRFYDITTQTGDKTFANDLIKINSSDEANTGDYTISTGTLRCPNDKPVLTKNKFIYEYDTGNQSEKCHAVYPTKNIASNEMDRLLPNWRATNNHYYQDICYLDPLAKKGNNQNPLVWNDYCPSLQAAITNSLSNPAAVAAGQAQQGGSIRGGGNQDAQPAPAQPVATDPTEVVNEAQTGEAYEIVNVYGLDNNLFIELKTFFMDADTDKDGALSFDEFKVAAKKDKPNITDSQVKEAFYGAKLLVSGGIESGDSMSQDEFFKFWKYVYENEKNKRQPQPQNNATMLAQTGSVNPTMNRAIYDASGNLIFENTAAGAGMGLGLGAGLGFGIGMSLASCKGSNLNGGSLTNVSNSITESSDGLTRDGTDGGQFTDITNLADNGKFDVFNYGKVDGRDSKDNRLGGSESAYTDRYKPEDSSKSKIKFFDSVWRI